MKQEPRELIIECVAKAIYEAERTEGQCADSDTFVSYLPAANAAIQAYQDYIRRQS